ncbi:hypothetical protein AtEden1_Chr00c002g0322551 [Arabidopsis thaliana]
MPLCCQVNLRRIQATTRENCALHTKTKSCWIVENYLTKPATRFCLD